VFAFFTGFVVSAMWGQVNNADVRARAEGAAAVQVARDLTVFDKADSDRIRQSLVEYERAAVAQWPHGGERPFVPGGRQRSKAPLYRIRGR